MDIINGRLKGVRFLPANSYGGSIKPSLIVVHDTAGRLDKYSSVDWFRSKACKTSAHVVVERDGTITQMVPFDKKAFHAGESTWNGKRYCNSFAVGIEIVNPGKMDSNGHAWFGKATTEPVVRKKTPEHGDGYWLPYTKEQVKVVQEICRALMQEYPDVNEIVTHFQISPKRKIDTNPLFPLDAVYTYAIGATDPEPEVISDKPVVLEPKETTDTTPISPKTIAKVSRKARWLSRFGAALNSIWLSISAVTLADWLDYGRETFDALTHFITDHAMALAVATALLGAVVIRHIQSLMVEDVREGRYVPSGTAELAPLGMGEGESDPGKPEPVGQPA
jgi:N-acetylmuramoyl-L-alanine amidase